jgi:hypothetical protein
MRRFTVATLLAVLFLSQALLAGPFPLRARADNQATQDITQQLKHYNLVQLDAQDVAAQVRQTGRLSLPTSAGALNLSLFPYDIRADGYQAEEVAADGSTRFSERSPVFTFRGTVEGMPGTQARFTIDGRTIEGLIITATQKYFIEPVSQSTAAVGSKNYVVYQESDLIKDSLGTCPANLAAALYSEADQMKSSSPVLSAQSANVAPALISPAREAEVATEADNEFVQALGGTQAANNEILSIMNMIDGIYQNEIGLRLRVVFQRAWDPATPDPYSDTTDVGTLLNELRAQWNNNPPAGAPSRDLVHMWTGKTMNAAGFAFGGSSTPGGGVVCRDAQFAGGSAAYGLVMRFTNAITKVVVSAHEIGHNFGATHPDQENPPHNECATTIMNSDATNATATFCQFSRDQITNYLNGSANGVTPNNACLAVVTAPASTVQLSAATYLVQEGTDKSAQITVTRSDGTGTASVFYETVNQSASERSDYTTARGALTFANGETSKTFSVFITDDVYAEGSETFGILLSNPTGASLNAPSSATVTIVDNDSVDGANPVKDATFVPDFFVRQHYIDFLNREADASGLAFWVGQITECESRPVAERQPCRETRRINVSGAFFLSIEFQETGFYVVRVQRVAFGRRSDTASTRITYNQFIADAAQVGKGVVVGQPGADQLIEQNKQAYADQIVSSAAFMARFPAQSASAYVDALYQSAGVQPTPTEKQDAIVAFGNGDNAGRAAALRKVADSNSVRQAEVSPAFVLMQYFGYLRRDPDDAGYQFWLTKLNQFGGNYIEAEMVKAFITSIEYQQRFGP